MTDQPTASFSQDGPHQVLVAGRYRLRSLLGRGGTAEVWRAEDEALGREIAMKIVTVPTDESSQRAGDEARLLARLNHPGLVPVYDAGTTDSGRPWVVMELVEGETLADTVNRGPLPPERVAAIGRAIADALGYVHSQGMIHRDVKPANVLLGNDGRVRLTDFGIARLVDAAKVTATGMTVGTASYLAPEQVVGDVVGPSADIYALGLVLLECLTGRREYSGNTVEVALARLHRPPDVPPNLPAGWPGLLRAMTDREPGNRPRPAHVVADLDRVLAGGTATTVAPIGIAERTQVIDRTALLTGPTPAAAPVSPPVAPPAAGPVVPPAPPRPPPRGGGGAPPPPGGGAGRGVAGLALLALLAGGFFFTQRDQAPVRLPAVSEQLPDELERDLKQLHQELSRQ